MKDLAAKKTQPEPKPLVLKVVKQPAKSFRVGSARYEYWQRFQQFNGKPLNALEASCGEDPPSVPGDRSRLLAGKQEPFGGWVSFFKSMGLIKVV